MRCCATCRFWVPTEMEIYAPGAQPHQAREIAARQEMMRATNALCSWPTMDPEAAAFFAASPPWVRRSHAAGGYLTEEGDGSDCPCWQQRPDIQIGKSP